MQVFEFYFRFHNSKLQTKIVIAHIAQFGKIPSPLFALQPKNVSMVKKQAFFCAEFHSTRE